jgi:hypothetical protein
MNESSSKQHIKKNYHGNLNVCVVNLQKFHAMENVSTKCWEGKIYWDVNEVFL